MSDQRREDRIWKALADSTRRGLLDLLCVAPRTTGELCSAFPALGRTTVMKHLDVLEEAGLIVVRREGRVRWNHHNPVPIREIYERWIQPHVGRRAAALLALRDAAERRAGRRKSTRAKSESRRTPNRRRKR